MRTLPVAAAVALAVVLAPVLPPHTAAQDYPCAVPAPAPAPDPAPSEEHRFATGAGIRVAVIDTGVSPHPELDQLVAGRDFVTPDAPNPLLDCDGHGTVVAGVIAGTTLGVAPGAEIVAVRQTSAHYRNRRGGDDVQTAGSVRSLAEAIHAALDDGSRVINVSVVSCVDQRDAGAIDAHALTAALARAEQEGAVVVAAAGNVSESCTQGSFVFPSHFPTVIAVGARDTRHTVADYSVHVPGDMTPVSAPGTVDTGLAWSGGGFARGTAVDRDSLTPFVGTSFAAPVVSGTVALLLERHPHLSPANVRDIVTRSSQPAGGAITPLAVITHLPAHPPAEGAPLVVDPAGRRYSAALGRWRVVVTFLGAAAAIASFAALGVSRWRSAQTPG